MCVWFCVCVCVFARVLAMCRNTDKPETQSPSHLLACASMHTRNNCTHTGHGYTPRRCRARLHVASIFAPGPVQMQTCTPSFVHAVIKSAGIHGSRCKAALALPHSLYLSLGESSDQPTTSIIRLAHSSHACITYAGTIASERKGSLLPPARNTSCCENTHARNTVSPVS